MEECPSTEWSVRPDQSQTHASRLRPGRWPELLAPITTRKPPRISRARPYGQTAALHSKGRGADGHEGKERTNRLHSLKKNKNKKGQDGKRK